MEVAAFHPPAFEVRGLVSVALFVTSPCQGVTLHPALRSPDFPPSPLSREQRLPGRLPTLFYRQVALERPKVPLVLIELRLAVLPVPAGIAEDRQRRHVARRGLRGQRAQPGVGNRIGIRIERREDHLAADAGARLERLLEYGVAEHVHFHG